MWVQTIK